MKKWKIILPSLAATLSVPFISITGCQQQQEHVDPTIDEFEFHFNGSHCTINGQDKFTDEVKAGKTNVKYTILPEDGYRIKNPQDLPEGVHYKDNILTIDQMNQAYSVSFVAELIPTPTIKHYAYVINDGTENFKPIPDNFDEGKQYRGNVASPIDHTPIVPKNITAVYADGKKLEQGEGKDYWLEQSITAEWAVSFWIDPRCTYGDIAFVVDMDTTKKHIYIANNPDDGYTIDTHDIQEYREFDATITSTNEMIENNMSVLITIDGQPLEDGYTFTVDSQDHKKANLHINSGKIETLSGDVLVWINNNTPTITLVNPEDGYTIDKTTATVGEDLNVEITSAVEEMDADSLWKVTGDDKPITTYTFNVSSTDPHTATLTIPKEEISRNIRIGLRKTTAPIAQYFDDDGHEQDDWGTVIYYANKGIDALCEAYNCEPSWFVGKTRTFKLNGYDHKVRVVGVNQDYTDENGANPVTLSFQFENLISNQADGSRLGIGWLSYRTGILTNNYYYWNSSLENALNGEEPNAEWLVGGTTGSEKRSLYTMMKESDNVLTSNIKEVYRGVNVNINDDVAAIPTYKAEYRRVRLFAPTLSNLFSTEGINKTMSQVISKDDKVLYCNEGQKGVTNKQYQYYALEGNIQDDPVTIGSEAKTYDCLIHKACVSSGDAESYRIASPKLSYSETMGDNVIVWTIKASGAMQNDTGVWYTSFGVAPCFCI